MFFKRDLSSVLKRFSKFPVVALLGPRQSGKTTLAKHTFKKHLYLNLEDLELRNFAINDPKGFLKEYENKNGLILDEFQNVPDILSYIQVEVDLKKRPGYFVLTGSQNFLMNQAISQSLAGRIGILTLLPLSVHELAQAKQLTTLNELILNGSFPRLYAENFLPEEAYPSYIHSYIERDVRQVAQVTDIRIFKQFMSLCAGRTGQLLNVADIATNCGVERRIITQWLSVLEASYIIFLLPPYFNNFNKRVTKSPKLYFSDTGIACSLLGIRSAKDLAVSPFRGPLFETLLISDFYKQYYNRGMRPPLYFWRDQNGRVEIDCLVDKGIGLVPIELKSGQTINTNFFDPLKNWAELSESDAANGYVVYGGEQSQSRSAGHVIGWEAAGQLIDKIEK